MAFRNTVWYASYGDGATTGYYAVTKRPQNTAVAAGIVRRQFTTPSQNVELCFVCTIAGTTANATDATWVTTHGSKTTDGTATWVEITGQPGFNGDTTNCPVWSLSQTWAVGEVIYDSGTSSLQVCTTLGAGKTSGAPSFSATAGVTATDNVAVWTSAGLASGFGNFAAPYARLKALDNNDQNVLNTNGGHTIRVADNSAESYTGNPQFSFPVGSYSTLTNIVSVDHTTPGTLKAGASWTGNGSVNFTSGIVYMYGITWTIASGSTGLFPVNQNQLLVMDTCTFTTSGGGGNMQFGNSAPSEVVLISPTFTFGATSDYINLGGTRVTSYGGSIGGATFPTSFIKSSNTNPLLTMHGFDFSNLGSGKTICTPDNAALGQYTFIDGKLGASVTLATNPTQPNGGRVRFIRCDSGGTNYKQAMYDFYGTQSVETTIVRTGGATDGTTSQSWNLTTTANPSWTAPFVSDPIRIWNDTTGSGKTLTIYGIWGSGAVPNNDDIWIEVQYLGDSGDSRGLFINTTKATLVSSNAAITSDSSTWGGSTTKFKMVTGSFTPQLKGYITVRIKAAKASSTFYIDPKPVIA